MKNKVTVWTDGACSPNPGIGGWAYIFTYTDESGKKHDTFISCGGYKNTTNNRMELISVINALSTIPSIVKDSEFTIYTDSQYVYNGIMKNWAKKWKDNKWHKAGCIIKENRVKNPDLWSELLDLCEKHTVYFVWVKGHSDNENNNKCDELAVKATKEPNLAVDKFYEDDTLLETYYKD